MLDAGTPEFRVERPHRYGRTENLLQLDCRCEVDRVVGTQALRPCELSGITQHPHAQRNFHLARPITPELSQRCGSGSGGEAIGFLGSR